MARVQYSALGRSASPEDVEKGDKEVSPIEGDKEDRPDHVRQGRRSTLPYMVGAILILAVSGAVLAHAPGANPVHLPNGITDDVFEMAVPMTADWYLDTGKHVVAYLEALPLDANARREVWTPNGEAWDVQTLTVEDLGMPCIQGYFLDDTTSHVMACKTKDGIKGSMDYYPTTYSCKDCFSQGIDYQGYMDNITATGPCECQASCQVNSGCMTFTFHEKSGLCTHHSSTEMVRESESEPWPGTIGTISHSGHAKCPLYNTYSRPNLPELKYVYDTDYAFGKRFNDDAIYAHQMIDFYSAATNVIYKAANIANIRTVYRRVFTGGKDVYNMPYEGANMFDTQDFWLFKDAYVERYWKQAPAFDAAGANGLTFVSGLGQGMAWGGGSICGSMHRYTGSNDDDRSSILSPTKGQGAFDNTTLTAFHYVTWFSEAPTDEIFNAQSLEILDPALYLLVHEYGHPLDGWHDGSNDINTRSQNLSVTPLNSTQCDFAGQGLIRMGTGFTYDRNRYKGCVHNQGLRDCSTIMSYDGNCAGFDENGNVVGVEGAADWAQGIGHGKIVLMSKTGRFLKMHFSELNKRNMQACARNAELGKSLPPFVPPTTSDAESVADTMTLTFENRSQASRYMVTGSLTDTKDLPIGTLAYADWIYQRGKTYVSIVADTGPGTDVTLGTASGTFIYTKAFKTPKGQRWLAALYPKCVTGRSATALSFYYHAVSRTCNTKLASGVGYFDGRCSRVATILKTVRYQSIDNAMKPLKVYAVSSDGTKTKIFTGVVDDDSTVESNPAPPPPPPFVPVDGCHDNRSYVDAYGYKCRSGHGPCKSFTKFGWSQAVIDKHLYNCPESCSDVTPTNRESPGEPCPERAAVPADTRWRHASITTSGNVERFEFIAAKGENVEDDLASDAALDDVSWTCT